MLSPFQQALEDVKTHEGRIALYHRLVQAHVNTTVWCIHPRAAALDDFIVACERAEVDIKLTDAIASLWHELDKPLPERQ